jgi:hypothetical protein
VAHRRGFVQALYLSDPTRYEDGAALGLGRIVALCHRSSASYQIHFHSRCLYFCSEDATEPYAPRPPAPQPIPRTLLYRITSPLDIEHTA